ARQRQGDAVDGQGVQALPGQVRPAGDADREVPGRRQEAPGHPARAAEGPGGLPRLLLRRVTPSPSLLPRGRSRGRRRNGGGGGLPPRVRPAAATIPAPAAPLPSPETRQPRACLRVPPLLFHEFDPVPPDSAQATVWAALKRAFAGGERGF